MNMIRIKCDMNIPRDILMIHEFFKTNGFKLFLVGGSVRDFLSNEIIKDYDLATDAIPDKVESMMEEAGLRTLATGKAFGVINVFTDNDEFEIATFRTDSKEGDGRRPDSVTFTTIEGDVLRRDLTINALFFDLDTSEIVDMVGGVEDLKNGIIRTVGDASERFEEDRLRILRAIRFVSRFDGTLSKDIKITLIQDSSLEGISSERIRDEFIKGLKSAKSVIKFMNLLDTFGLFDWIFPNMVINKNFIEENDPILVMATLLKDNKLSLISTKLNKLTHPTSDINKIIFLLTLHTIEEIDTAVILKKSLIKSDVSSEQLFNFGIRNMIDSKFLNALEDFELTVSGDEVMKEFNLKPSKELGDKIVELEIENFKKLL